MKRKELVYRELLEHAIGKKRERLTQLGLSKKLGISISTVNNAIRPLRALGAVAVKPGALLVMDAEKIAAYWGSVRKLKGEIAYETRAVGGVREIEGGMPSEAIFTAYSAYRLLFDDAPSDYGEVVIYADGKALEEIKRRFPEKGGPANLIVLKPDRFLARMALGGCAPLSQIHVDLWNLGTWQAKEYLNALERQFGWK